MHIASFALNTLIGYAIVKIWPKISAWPKWRKFFTCACAISSGLLFIEALAYVLTPSYFNYTEVNLVNISAYWLKGHDIFTTIDSPERYSVLYGPWTTVMNAFFLLPGLFILQASKLSGFLHLTLTLIMFWVLVNRQFFLLGLLCLCFLGFDNYAYVIRPDSFIIAYSLAAFFLLEMTPKKNIILAYVAAGILMGLSVACKVHGFVYFLPTFAYGFKKVEKKKHILLSLLTVTIGVAVSFAPFLLPGVSFKNYSLWLHSTSKHGLSLSLFTDCLTYGIPFLACAYLCGFAKEDRFTFATLTICVIVASIFGSLVGAGTHHLMPFFTMLIFFSARSYRKLNAREQSKAHLLIAAILMALIYDAFNSQKAMAKYFRSVPEQLAQFEDLKALRAKLNGPMELGYGDFLQLEMSYYKPYFVAHGDPLFLDVDALMDMGASGLEFPESTYKTLESCSIPYFILPKGDDIWHLGSGYGYPIFPDRWRETFKTRYRPTENSAFYTVYQCKKP